MKCWCKVLLVPLCLLPICACVTDRTEPVTISDDIVAVRTQSFDEMKDILELQDRNASVSARLKEGLGEVLVEDVLDKARNSIMSQQERSIHYVRLQEALKQERSVIEAEMNALNRLVVTGGGGF